VATSGPVRRRGLVAEISDATIAMRCYCSLNRRNLVQKRLQLRRAALAGCYVSFLIIAGRNLAGNEPNHTCSFGAENWSARRAKRRRWTAGRDRDRCRRLAKAAGGTEQQARGSMMAEEHGPSRGEPFAPAWTMDELIAE